MDADKPNAASATTAGARVCDPQQLCQPDGVRIKSRRLEISTLLRLTEPRSEIFVKNAEPLSLYYG
jgi:hypothetical protein